jgi:hypothetical protein
MIHHTDPVSWSLIATFGISVVDESYRCTAKAGTSGWDSAGSFLRLLPLYAVAFALAVLVRTGWRWAAWTTLAFGTASILVSILYHGPVILPQRKPGRIDWFEDRTYTGLLFVAVALLAHDLLGGPWSPRERRQPATPVSRSAARGRGRGPRGRAPGPGPGAAGGCG